MRRQVSIERIQDEVSERFGLSKEELIGDRRSQNIVYPRQVAMYLSRELTDSSLPRIGRHFGGRDHTTVIHATSKIARLIREDRSVYNLVQELTARVKQAGRTVDVLPASREPCSKRAPLLLKRRPQASPLSMRNRAVFPGIHPYDYYYLFF